jgi:hypothetical protein
MACLPEASEIDFVTPMELIRLPLAELGLGVSQRSPIVIGMLAVVGASWLFLTVSSLASAVILSARRLLSAVARITHLGRREGVAQQRRAPWLLRLVPIANLGGALLITLGLFMVASVLVVEFSELNMVVLFGLPGYAAWVQAIFLGGALSGAIGFAGTLVGLVRGNWSGLRKAYQACLSGSALVISLALVLLVAWGLLWSAC